MMWQRTVLAALISVGVYAHTPPSLAGEAPRVHNWTGLHVGAHGGSIRNDQGATLAPANFDANFYFTFKLVPRDIVNAGESAMFGGQAGYDWQAGPFVYGIEADLSHTRIEGSGSGHGFLLANIDTAAERKLSSFGSLRARLGVKPFARTLIYATGGLAFGRASLSSNVTLSDLSGTPICGAATGLCASGSTSKWLTGGIFGAGLEQALSANWSARIEALYYNLGSLTLDFEDTTATPGQDPLFRATADFRGHIVRFGVNYKFN